MAHENPKSVSISFDASLLRPTITRSKNSRSRSHNDWIYSSHITENGAKLGKQAFDEIIQRLKLQQLWTSRMSQSQFQWLFPRFGTNIDQLRIFQAFMECPMATSNADLKKILILEESTLESLPAATGQQHFYFRSWVFTIAELKKVIGFMSETDNTFDEVEAWRKTVQEHEKRMNAASTDVLTLRYVGTCQGPKRPIDRFWEDFNSRRSGLLYEFVRVVKLLAPKIHNHAKVYQIKQASLGFIASYNADDVERILIEYFGHATLLNRQRGGYYTSYVPLATDDNLFCNLNTQFYSHFLQDTTVISKDVQMSVAVKTHFGRVQLFANENPSRTGTEFHSFSKGVLQACVKQAVPSQYKGNTIVVFIGKDITREDFESECTFLGGKSRAGLLTRDFLRRLAELEEVNRGERWENNAFDPAFFNFVDLWPWLWHLDEDIALDFLREYMSIARPIFAVTYSRSVNGMVRANFGHAATALSTTFTTRVGDLSIQYYTKNDGTNHNLDDDAFINIPHIHPGRAKYGIEDIELKKVLDLTMQLTFLVGQITLETIDKFSIQQPVISRKQLCEKILSGFHTRMGTSNGQVWSKAFLDAKSALQKKWATKFNRKASEDAKPILTSIGLESISQLGKAKGLPNSSERKSQLESLWDQNIADLHLHIFHSPDLRQKQRWIKSFLSLQTGQLLFLKVIAGMDRDVYLNHLLARFRPEWLEDDSWFTNPGKDRQSLLASGLWVHQKEIGPKSKSIYRHFPDELISTESMQGRNVGVLPDGGRFTLRWSLPDGSSVPLKIASAVAIPEREQDIRAVSFTPFGLDIVDADGTPLRPKLRDGSEAKATILSTSFMSSKAGEMLMKLWRDVLNHLNLAPDASEDEQDDAREWGEVKGVQRLSATAREEKPRQNRPPRPLDANYLLDQFLNARFPNGGRFRTATKDRDSSSTEDLNAFVLFLKSAEYRKHPFARLWLSDFDKERPKTEVLFKNLQVCRSAIKTRATGTKKETYFDIGLPDSATVVSFELASGAGGSNETGTSKRKRLDDSEGRRPAKK